MPRSALPPHLQDVEHAFPDDDQFIGIPIFGVLYRWIQKKTKTWFAFSYRCPEWWARTRKYPKVLFAVGGKGPWRIEKDGWGVGLALGQDRFLKDRWYDEIGNYVSRVQLYKRWSFVIQWPLTVTLHFYPRAKDVVDVAHPFKDTDGTLWFAYWGHFDADLVHWLFGSVFIGRNWK